MSIKIKINNKGISLIETLLALTIAIIVITSLVSLSVYTLRASQQSKYLMESSKIASEHIELLRIYKDSNSWKDFKTAIDPNCVSLNCYTDGNSITSGEVILGSLEAKKYLRVTIVGDNVVTVRSFVTWKIGDQDRKTVIVSDITNWRGK